MARAICERRETSKRGREIARGWGGGTDVIKRTTHGYLGGGKFGEASVVFELSPADFIRLIL